MNDGETDRDSGDAAASAEVLDEVRLAASAVVASLKRFVEATERVVEDPAAFGQVVDNGRSVVEAFVAGFAEQVSPPEDGEPNADGEDISAES